VGLRSTVELIAPSYSDHGISIELTAPAHLPSMRGSAAALNQVIMNLIKNGADALSATGGVVRVDAFEADGEVVVTVRDDGPGIDDNDLSKIFEPFFTTKPAGEGTGLGLSMSRKIAHDHGGFLRAIESKSGGAHFELRLPLPDRPS